MVEIRKGKKEDIPAVLELIKELAVYENALDQVNNTEEEMLKDGFGEAPVFMFWVAVNKDQIVGTAICYYRYSTWKGKKLYLEDLIVTQSHRRMGIGKKLFDAVLDAAKQEQCTGMSWQVLDWNEDAIAFYKEYPTQFDGEWVNCNIDF